MISARLFAVAAMLAVATLDTADAAKTSKYGTSFVDADDDGVFDPGTDIFLSSILDAAEDGGYFSTGQARPGYTPPPPPVGIVLEGKVTLVDGGDLEASGTIRVRGSVVSIDSEPDDYNSLNLYSPNLIEIAPRAKITHKSAGALYVIGGDVTIGERVRITALADVWLGVNGTLVTGENVQVRSTGNKEDFEPSVWVLALNMQLGDGFYMRANDYADCLFEHNGDVQTDMVLNELRVRCGYIELAAYSHPEGNRIRLTNSYLDSRTPDGNIRFYVDEGPDGYLPNALVIENSSIRARGTIDYDVPFP